MLQSITSINYSNKIIDLVGPEIVSFKKYIQMFTKRKNVKTLKIDLESAYYDSIHNSKAPYGVDDLNILVGNFIGNHKTLEKISGFSFTNFRKALKSSGLS